MRRLLTYSRPLILALFLLKGILGDKAMAQATDYKAYSLFVYNFMKYVEWPEAQSKGDFVVAVLGDSPILKELEVLASTKKLKGRNIVIKKITAPEEGSSAHLMYVASGKSSALKAATDKTKPVLIVGEREGLAKKGASLSFVTLEDDELKFDINKKELEARQLKISSQLVNLGIVIN